MISFAEIKQRYSENPLPILRELVGAGEIRGSDYVALNPRRNDKHRGSFRIDIATGRFYDFATGDRGGCVIDLAAFVYNCGVVEAAQRLESLFPFLADTSVAADTIPAKKKKFDAVYIWNKSTKVQHQYLNKKKVAIGNARVNLYKGKAQLVIPLTDTIPEKAEDLEIKGLQFISEDGLKIFPLPFKGLFHVASDYERSKNVIVIAEGYATVRSIAESLAAPEGSVKSSNTTVCRKISKIDLDTESKLLDSCTHDTGSKIILAAMSSVNMKPVAEKIAEQFPDSRIIIAADNDEAGRKAELKRRKRFRKKFHALRFIRRLNLMILTICFRLLEQKP